MSGHVAHVEAHVQVPDVVATADVLGCLVGQGRRNVTRLLSDQGREFESDLFAELCKCMEIDKVRTSPYHPSCNGGIERFH